MTLAQLQPGKCALIADVTGGHDGLRARMFALGLRAGREVAVIRCAGFGGPLHIRVGSTDLMLRRSEAALVSLQPNDQDR